MNRPRQVINYHVRELARAGFLRRAGRVRKRGLVEQRYVVSAQAFVLAPEMLGAIDATRPASDRRQGQRGLHADARHAAATGAERIVAAGRMRPARRCRCCRSIPNSDSRRPPIAPASRRRSRKAITTVVAEHTTPADRSAEGRYRLVLGCYPTPDSWQLTVELTDEHIERITAASSTRPFASRPRRCACGRRGPIRSRSPTGSSIAPRAKDAPGDTVKWFFDTFGYVMDVPIVESEPGKTFVTARRRLGRTACPT